MIRIRFYLLLLLSLSGGSAWAIFSISYVNARFDGPHIVVNAEAELELSAVAEAALNKGVNLDLITEFQLTRVRPFLWNKGIDKWSWQARLRYHALSGRYVVIQADRDEMKTYRTVREALGAMGRIRGHRLQLSQAIDQTADQYTLAMRIRLNIEALPVPLRPQAYTSKDWDLKSPWVQWRSGT